VQLERHSGGVEARQHIGVKQYNHAKHNYLCGLCLQLYGHRCLHIQLLNLCGGIMAPTLKTMPPPGPTHGPGWHKCMPCASLTPSDGTQGVFRGLPWLKIGKLGQNRSKSIKIAPKPAEKRLKRFAPPIKHDEAQYQHTFNHRMPWYRQRSAISAPTRLPATGCSGPENAAFFETAVGHICGIAANPLSACGGKHGLFFNLMPLPSSAHGPGRPKCMPSVSLTPSDGT
jgi:hypothetical protein